MRVIVYFSLFLAAGCGKPDPASPRGAFQSMAPCVDSRDARCLFGKLDRDSRWSVQTIHKYLREASSLVEKAYPQDQRKGAFGSWREEAAAADPEAAFEAWCLERRCLERVVEGFGAIVKIDETAPDTVVVETTRGGSFEMFLAEGRWGLAIFRGELQEGKLRALDRLEQIKANASEFDEQARAVGSPAPEREKEKEYENDR